MTSDTNITLDFFGLWGLQKSLRTTILSKQVKNSINRGHIVLFITAQQCGHLSCMQASWNCFSHLIGDLLKGTCERKCHCNNFYLTLIVRYTLKYVHKCNYYLLILKVNSLFAMAFVIEWDTKIILTPLWDGLGGLEDFLIRQLYVFDV